MNKVTETGSDSDAGRHQQPGTSRTAVLLAGLVASALLLTPVVAADATAPAGPPAPAQLAQIGGGAAVASVAPALDPSLFGGVPADASASALRRFAARDYAAGEPEVVRSALARAGIRDDEYGLVVRPLGNGRLGASHLPDEGFNPASAMKLVTTNAALSLLGLDYRWVTRLYTTGRIENGALLGDLILRGGGDPKFVIDDMRQLVQTLHAAGMNEIRGDLVIDDGLYAVGPQRLASFDGDELAPYNVTPYAAMMNFNATRFEFDPAAGELRMDPPLADVPVENAVRVTRGRCTGASVSVRELGDDARPLLRVSGHISSRCGPWRQYGSALSHRAFIHGMFKAAWLESGGVWRGRTVTRPGAASGRPYYEWVSPGTLADIVHDVNKHSNNVMARMLMLQIAANVLARPATLDDARRIVTQFYADQGLPLHSLVLDNGSGLSRVERISAADLTAVLAHADSRVHGAVFEDSLPQVGVDGTMRSRLRNDPVYGNAFIKTGTLSDARAIAGYVEAASGERYAVALLVNGPRADGARRAQDLLLSWVHENG